MPFLSLPIEIRLQIWSYVVEPTLVYPCECAPRDEQCKSLRLDVCCRNTSTYTHCDNRVLRLNRQIFAEVAPLVRRAEQDRVFVLCNNLCLDNFFKSLDVADWRWVRHLRVDLFVGWGREQQDDWFLSQSHRWARRYVMGALDKYSRGREMKVEPEKDVKEDTGGRRTLRVDIYLD